jgi:hypothetical protein
MKPSKIQFPAFDQSEFSNIPKPTFASNRAENDKLLVPHQMKLQIMEEKLKTIENKQIEETKNLIDIINKNMFNATNQLNNSLPHAVASQSYQTPRYNKYTPKNVEMKSAGGKEFEEDKEEQGKKNKNSMNKDDFDDFKVEIRKHIRNLKHRGESNHVDDVLNEIDILKKTLKTNDKVANERRKWNYLKSEKP